MNGLESGKRRPHPLASAARQGVVSRLRAAARLADEDLEANAAVLRELVDEALDQAEAFAVAAGSPAPASAGGAAQAVAGETTRAATAAAVARRAAAPPREPGTFARVPVSRLSSAQGDPVAAFLLIPFGVVQVERPSAGGDFVFTRRHAESAKRWFDAIGRKLAIDYEHQSFDQFNTRADGLRPAAGWIGGLEVREDGLWAIDVTWTERARELLRSGEYRYFSPVIYWTDADHADVAALGPVGLTNDPAMRGAPALAARRAHTRPDDEPGRTDADAAAGGAAPRPDAARRAAALRPDEPPAAALHAHASPPAAPQPEEREPLSVLRGELDAAKREIESLRQELAGRAADAFVERGLRAGKILPSTQADWRDDYLRDPPSCEARLSRAPVLLPPGRILGRDTAGDGAIDDRVRSAWSRHAALCERWGIEPEDLRAYEQAAAAGRVRCYGA